MRRIEFTEEADRALVHAWLSQEPLEDVATRLKVGRSTLYRRAKDLGLEAREPRKGNPGPRRARPWVPVRGSPLVRKLFRIMNREEVSLSEVAKAVGVTREAIGAWRTHSSPQLLNFEAALNYLGYELVIKERVKY